MTATALLLLTMLPVLAFKFMTHSAAGTSKPRSTGLNLSSMQPNLRAIALYISVLRGLGAPGWPAGLRVPRYNSI